MIYVAPFNIGLLIRFITLRLLSTLEDGLLKYLLIDV